MPTPSESVLPSFGLSDRADYQRWWDARHATNNHVSLGPRFRWVIQHMPLPPAKVLEIGCQTGGFTLPLLQSGYSLTAVDLVAENLGIVRAGAMREGWVSQLKTLHSFAEDLTFESEFDVVLLCEVLIHVTDDRLVLSNAWRAVCPGGSLIVTVPYRDLYQGVEHSRYYDEPSFRRRMLDVLPRASRWTAQFAALVEPGDEHPHTLGAAAVKP